MSHITRLKLSLKNLDCVKRAVDRLEGAKVVATKKRQLLNKDRNVLELSLPSFRMPVFVDIKTGEVFNDNFGGRWGDLKVYDKFQQLYASEVAKDFAAKNNYTYVEEEISGGHLRCTLTANESPVTAYSGGY